MRERQRAAYRPGRFASTIGDFVNGGPLRTWWPADRPWLRLGSKILDSVVLFYGSDAVGTYTVISHFPKFVLRDSERSRLYERLATGTKLLLTVHTVGRVLPVFSFTDFLPIWMSSVQRGPLWRSSCSGPPSGLQRRWLFGPLWSVRRVVHTYSFPRRYTGILLRVGLVAKNRWQVH